MAVSREEVARIAGLAKLQPEEETIGRLTEELNGILEQIRLLEEVDVTGVDEAGGAAADLASFRDPDLAPDGLESGAPASIAPEWTDGFFVVPRLPALDADAAKGEEG